MSRWNERSDVPRGDDYDARWRRLEAQGESIHGEADLIALFEPDSVLDAGCGTGRVAIELAERGVDVVGVDLDPDMLAHARAKAPLLTWTEADLATVTVPDEPSSDSEAGIQGSDPGHTPRRFDVVAMAGNVMIFVRPGTEGAVVANMARHLLPDGLLIAGFQLQAARFSLPAYDSACADAGLQLEARWAGWDQSEWRIGGDYAVSVHRRTG